MDRQLQLNLLRARGAAHRYELALAIHDISARLAPVFRAAQTLQSARRTLRHRGRLLGWILTIVVGLGRRYWLRRAVSGIAAKQLSRFPPWVRLVGTAVVMALATFLKRRNAPREAAADAD